jgi:hypothetical protein
MKITDICESTTAGSIATVAAPMNSGPLKRSAVGKGVYGKEPAGSIFKGKKTSKPFANSKVNEAAGEHVTVLYIDGKPAAKYTDITKAKQEVVILKSKFPDKKFELKQEVREAGMPQSVLKNKQKLAGMTDAELASHLKGKSDDELKRMAWRHGYGNMSPHYVNRIKKVTESTDTSKYKVQIICDDGGETSYTVYAKTKEEAWRKATKFANDDGYEDFQAKIITEPSKKPVRESVDYPGIKDDEELREFQKYPDAFSLYNKLRKDGVAFTKVHPRGKNRVDFDIVMNDRRHSLQMRAPGAMYEAQLDEEDLILVPGQGHRLKTGFIPHGESRIDHEVEMAKSDLFSAAKNA